MECLSNKSHSTPIPLETGGNAPPVIPFNYINRSLYAAEVQTERC